MRGDFSPALMKKYQKEAGSLLHRLRSAVVRFYESPERGGSILPLVATLRRSARMMGFPSVDPVLQALEELFCHLLEAREELGQRSHRLVHSCLGAVEGVLLSASGFGDEKAGERLESLARTLSLSLGKEDVSFPSQEQGEGLAEVVEVASLQVGVDEMDRLLCGYDSVMRRGLHLQHCIEALDNQLVDEHSRFSLAALKEGARLLGGEMEFFLGQLEALQRFPVQEVLDIVAARIRQLLRDCGKEVSLDLPASDVMVDSFVLRELPGIMVPLARYALVYGIEPARHRLKLGKERSGRLFIGVRQEAARVVVTIQDDGAGVDVTRLRSRIAELGLEKPQRVAALEDQEVYRFLFSPEFSCMVGRQVVSSKDMGLSGLWQKVESLSGSLHVSSEPHHGMRIVVSLPLSVRVQEGIFVQIACRKLLFLSHYVQEIATVSSDSIIKRNAAHYISVREELIPLYNPALLFGRGQDKVELKSSVMVLVMCHLNKRWAVSIDRLLYHKRVMVQPLPPLLRGVQTIQGVVLDEEQRFVPVLRPDALLARLQSICDYQLRSFEVNSRVRQRSVLVVDDSATTSQIQRMMLEAEGYRVEVVRDGIEALARLKASYFNLLVTDVLLPRMDGLVLIQNVRRMAEYRTMPVVVVSSVFEEDTEMQVLSAGGQACISKADFKRERLVSLVKELLDG